MQLQPFTDTVHVHTKLSRAVKRAVTQHAKVYGVPENSLMNTVLGNFLKAAAPKTAPKKKVAKKKIQPKRRK